MRGRSLAVRLANFVKLPHTVFAMPFALVGVLLASVAHPVSTATAGWVVLAFTSARFAAMGFNRIVDRDVDALNPRTALRELPSGTLTLMQAAMAVVLASVLFFAASFRLNPLCAALSPVALLWVLGYSYSKRFTRFSHFWLGVGLSVAPVGGYLAVAGAWSTPWWVLCALALAVVAWTAGFDILYALQDVDFDRSNRLHSFPASIGVPRAIVLARLLHATAVACLALVALGVPRLGLSLSQPLVWLGVTLAAVLLVWEHRLVKPSDLSRLDAAFFTMNGIISLTFFGCVLAARLVGATAALPGSGTVGSSLR